jgi:hypothetical protein
MRSALSTGAPPFPIPGIAPQKQAENFEKKAIFTVKSSPRKKKRCPTKPDPGLSIPIRIRSV